MAGIPQDQLTELKRINANIKDVEAIVTAIAAGVDLAPVLAAIAETNRLLAVLVDNEAERKATSLGGTYAEVPNPPKP